MEEYTDYSFCRNLMSYDEQILWTGCPEVWGVLSSVPFSSYVTSLVWIVVCLFMYKLIKETATEAEQIFRLLWVVFVGVGIYGLFVWPFQAYYQQKNTCYVITNKKIYRQRGRKVKTLSASEMSSYNTIYSNHGTGTISFPISIMIPGATRPYRTEFKLENLRDTDHALQAISRMDHSK